MNNLLPILWIKCCSPKGDHNTRICSDTVNLGIAHTHIISVNYATVQDASTKMSFSPKEV